MKLKNLLITLGLTLTVGAGVAVGIGSHNNFAETEANNTSVTFYLAIDASKVSDSAPYYSRRREGSNWEDGISMTLVEDGITYSGKKVYSSTFTELYGGVDMYIKYGDGGDGKVVHPWNGDWGTIDVFKDKVYTFENGNASTWESYTIPSRYSFIGSGSSWATDYDLSGSGTSYTISRTMSRGETFKIRRNHCWYQSFGYAGTTKSGVTSVFGTDGDDNFKCLLDGSYSFTFNPNTPAITITDNTSVSTYSYILTANSVYSCAYLFDANGEYTTWADAPAVSTLDGGIAYNVKVAFGGQNYYGLYRINDRYINSFTTLIMKTSGSDNGKYDHQTDDIPLSGGSKVYLTANDESPTSAASSSAIYKAVALIYDIVTKRGSATYDGYTFDYSICAISKSDATSLVSRYDAIGSEAQTILGNSTCNVYKLTGGYSESNKEDRSFTDIVDSLRLIANRGTGIGARIFNLGSESGQSAMLIVVIISSLGILTGGAYYFFRKSRKTEE